MQAQQTRFFALFGFAVWAGATAVFAAVGARFLEVPTARYWLHVALVVGAFVAAFRLAVHARRVERARWPHAALAMALPGMAGEIPVLYLFGPWMGGMRPETAGRFAALLFCGYAALLLYAASARERPAPALRSTLRMDAAVCLGAGATLVLGAGPLAPMLAADGFRVLGVGFEAFARGVGGAVLLIGLGVAAVARMRAIHAGAVWPILAVEVLWFTGSLALLAAAGAELTTLGAAVVAAGAMAVLAFLVAEWLGLADGTPGRRDAHTAT